MNSTGNDWSSFYLTIELNWNISSSSSSETDLKIFINSKNYLVHLNSINLLKSIYNIN